MMGVWRRIVRFREMYVCTICKVNEIKHTTVKSVTTASGPLSGHPSHPCVSEHPP